MWTLQQLYMLGQNRLWEPKNAFPEKAFDCLWKQFQDHIEKVKLTSQLQHFIPCVPKIIKKFPGELYQTGNTDNEVEAESAVQKKNHQHLVNHTDLIFPAYLNYFINTDFIVLLAQNFMLLVNI